MTTHIKNKIEETLFSGGIVINKLKNLVNILESIRGIDSINMEFAEAFEHIEKTKGTIMQKTKDDIFLYINDTQKYKNEMRNF